MIRVRVHLLIDARGALKVLQFGLAFLHFLIAGIAFWRPAMNEIVPSYAAFAAVMPITAWGAWAGVIALGLAFLPRTSGWLIVWQFMSASIFAAFSYLVSGIYGVTWGTGIYGGVALLSYLAMYATAQDWLSTKRRYVRLQGRVMAHTAARAERRRGG